MANPTVLFDPNLRVDIQLGCSLTEFLVACRSRPSYTKNFTEASVEERPEFACKFLNFSCMSECRCAKRAMSSAKSKSSNLLPSSDHCKPLAPVDRILLRTVSGMLALIKKGKAFFLLKSPQFQQKF
jgi:hypothetical protein